MNISRRTLLGLGGAGVAAGVAAIMAGGEVDAQPVRYPVHFTDAQWRARLSPQQYAVLRQAATERAGSSPLDREHRAGTFHCAGCNQPLFSSRAKFESGTGWPSFFQPLPRAIGTRRDQSLLEQRTEVHCARCGGHLGHVFTDVPRPTGLRYCMNGIAMTFRPA